MKYFTGKPCKRGHVAERYESTRQCVECQNENRKQWRAENPGRYRELDVLQYWKDPVANAAKKREWRQNNPEKRMEIDRKWRLNHLDKARNFSATRRASRIGATPKWLTDQQKLETQQKYTLARIHEAVTGMKWQVDHIIPLRGKEVCGLHVPWNLQVIPAKENVRKGAKFEVEQ